MLLGEILHREVIQPDLQASDKFEAIHELIDLAVEADAIPLNLRDHVVAAVESREKSMPTGMEMGVALPHASSDRMDRLVGVLGISREGIPFDCLDDKDAHLIILLVLPRDEFQIHVRTLAGISHLLNDGAFRDALIEARDVDTILRLIQGEEKRSLFDRFRLRRR